MKTSMKRILMGIVAVSLLIVMLPMGAFAGALERGECDWTFLSIDCDSWVEGSAIYIDGADVVGTVEMQRM